MRESSTHQVRSSLLFRDFKVSVYGVYGFTCRLLCTSSLVVTFFLRRAIIHYPKNELHRSLAQLGASIQKPPGLKRTSVDFLHATTNASVRTLQPLTPIPCNPSANSQKNCEQQAPIGRVQAAMHHTQNLEKHFHKHQLQAKQRVHAFLSLQNQDCGEFEHQSSGA